MATIANKVSFYVNLLVSAWCPERRRSAAVAVIGLNAMEGCQIVCFETESRLTIFRKCTKY